MQQRNQIRWEWFEVRDLGNGLVGLWNPASRRWLRACRTEKGDVRVDSPSQEDTFQDWWKAEFFQLVDVGDGHVGLYNPLVQRWVGASPEGKAVAIQSTPELPSDTSLTWERFRVVPR